MTLENLLNICSFLNAITLNINIQILADRQPVACVGCEVLTVGFMKICSLWVEYQWTAWCHIPGV
jgi:hypothetical protein